MGLEKTGKPRVVGSAGIKGGEGARDAEGGGAGAGVVVVLCVSGASRGEGRPFCDPFFFSLYAFWCLLLKRRRETHRGDPVRFHD